MAEAAGGGGGRAGVERSVIEKSLQDESFRQRLLEDPKAALEEEIGTRTSAGSRVPISSTRAAGDFIKARLTRPLSRPGMPRLAYSPVNRRYIVAPKL